MAEKTVTVEALEYHTYDGKEYEVGDTYDIDEQYVESVASQGKAVRVDRVKVAKDAAKEGKASEKAAKDAAKEGKAGEKASAKAGQKVEAMRTDRASAPVRSTKQSKMKRTK